MASSICKSLVVGILIFAYSISYAEDTHKHEGNENAVQTHKGHSDTDDEHEDEKDHGHDDHEEHGDSGFGEGKAIVKVENEGQKFQLSKESESVLKIQTKLISKNGQNYLIPKSALVEYQSNLGVFVKRGNWYSLMSLKIVEKTKDQILIYSENLKSSEQIVVSGVALLRVAHMQASGLGGKGHAH